jgi:hypothetical protein
MEEDPTMIDRAYMVSVLDLREICENLSQSQHGYRLFRASDNSVYIRYTEDAISDFFSLNSISYVFPIVANMTPLSCLHNHEEAGMMVCLHIYTGKQTRFSYHLNDAGDVHKDTEGDWENFWQPLAAMLEREVEFCQ